MEGNNERISQAKSEDKYSNRKNLPHVRLYNHRETSDSSNPLPVMNIVVGEINEINPTINYETLMQKERKSQKVNENSKSVNITQRNNKLKKF